MAAELTTAEIKKIADDLVTLRKKIQATGATVLSSTPVLDGLRKEIALLNKKLIRRTRIDDVERSRLAQSCGSPVISTT